MAPTKEWHSIIATESHHLPPGAARQLRDIGFNRHCLVPRFRAAANNFPRHTITRWRCPMADPADVHIGRTGSSTRIDDFVNHGPEFDCVYIYPPLLTACCQITGAPFKLSGMRARTLNPRAPMEELHVDVGNRANGWPLVDHCLAASSWLTPSTPRTALRDLCRGLICSRENLVRS